MLRHVIGLAVRLTIRSRQNSYVKCCAVIYDTTSIFEIIKSLPFQCELTYHKLAVQFIESLDVGGESKRDWHR